MLRFWDTLYKHTNKEYRHMYLAAFYLAVFLVVTREPWSKSLYCSCTTKPIKTLSLAKKPKVQRHTDADRGCTFEGRGRLLRSLRIKKYSVSNFHICSTIQSWKIFIFIHIRMHINRVATHLHFILISPAIINMLRPCLV